MAAVRRRLGVPAVESGHTAAVGGYFAESHACAEDIEELLRDRLLAQSAFASALFAVLLRAASQRQAESVAERSRHSSSADRSEGARRDGREFNTREFFCGRAASFVRSISATMILRVLVLPLVLVLTLPLLAFLVQYAGLLGKRWSFFGEARHPQNLYYQGVS